MQAMFGFDRTASRIVGGLVAFCVIVTLSLAVGWCQQREATKRAKAERNVAVATGKALDKVAAETPVIRQEQAEKQREADQIPGADQRLPDGYGARLECVRRGDRDCDS